MLVNVLKRFSKILPVIVIVSIILIAGASSNRTYCGGGEWTPIGPDGGDIYYIHITGSHILFASTGSAVFRSFDYGNTWEPVFTPLMDVGFTSMDDVGGTLFAGLARHGGIAVSRDNGSSWELIALVDEEGAGRDTVSVSAASPSRVFFGIRGVDPETGVPCVYEVLLNGSTWKLFKHCLPVVPQEKVPVVSVAYSPNLGGLGEALLVSLYPEGLFIARDLEGNWSWIKVLEDETTDVDVDFEGRVIYVGTYGNWIWRGTLTNTSIEWVNLNPLEPLGLSVDTPPIITEVEVDPYNPDRFWWASQVKLLNTYPRREEAPCLSGAAAWDPSSGWLHSFTGKQCSHIAVDRGESMEFTTIIDGVLGARRAFAGSYSCQSVLVTEDGGRTWHATPSLPRGDNIFAVSAVNIGGSEAIVALCISGIEVSFDYGETWIDEFDVPPGDLEVGLPWKALQIPEGCNVTIEVDGVEYPGDFLVLGSYPAPKEKPRNIGLTAVSISYILEARRCRKPLIDGTLNLVDKPVVDGVVAGSRVVVTIQTEPSIALYDFNSGTFLETVIDASLSGGLVKIAYRNISSRDYWAISTYEGSPIYMPPTSNDHYTWYGPSRIYVAEGLLENPGNTSWKQVYPVTGREKAGVVGLSISPIGELLAAFSNGKIVYVENAWSNKPRIIVNEILGFGSGATLTDAEVDWNNGLIFISSLPSGSWEGGVHVLSIEELKDSNPTITPQPLNTGLKTRLVRDVELTSNQNYIIAGSWWMSAWRLKLNLNTTATLTSIEETTIPTTPTETVEGTTTIETSTPSATSTPTSTFTTGAFTPATTQLVKGEQQLFGLEPKQIIVIAVCAAVLIVIIAYHAMRRGKC